jgi:hypothetical protein
MHIRLFLKKRFATLSGRFNISFTDYFLCDFEKNGDVIFLNKINQRLKRCVHQRFIALQFFIFLFMMINKKINVLIDWLNISSCGCAYPQH